MVVALVAQAGLSAKTVHSSPRRVGSALSPSEKQIRVHRMRLRPIFFVCAVTLIIGVPAKI